MKNEKLIVFSVILGAWLLFASNAFAITVSQAVTVQLSDSGGGSHNATMASGSSFSSLTITSGAMNIVLGAGDSVSMSLGEQRMFGVDTPASVSCGSITLSQNKTYNVSIGGTCGGGGGGGGQNLTPTPTPTPEPTPTPTPEGTSGGNSGGGSSTPTPTPTPTTTTSTPEPTPIPQPTSSAPTVSIPQTELSYGESGDEVIKLQALLATDSSIYPEGKVTGYFGPATRAAVKRFQEKNGLASVGRVGPQTLAKLNEVFRFGYSAPAPQAPSAQSQGGALTRELEMGISGDDVTALQMYLAQDSSIYPEGKVTGYFGPATRAAVKRFQEKNGLPSVGRVGPMTLAKLNEVMGGNAGNSQNPAQSEAEQLQEQLRILQQQLQSLQGQ
jgi:peptidoglycan hydrolase-like protein with peptidoglycan-binding domain